MRPLLRVMAHVDTEHPIEMPSSVDEDVVQAFRADVLMNRSAKALALGARIGVRMTWTSSVRNTSSNGPENFVSRSCKRNLIAVSRSSMARFLACCVTHAESGCAVAPTKCTLPR